MICCSLGRAEAALVHLERNVGEPAVMLPFWLMDPRFDPIATSELPDLRYSVDILGAAEPATFDELDPKTYGVIVEDESGELRGLLLPDIKGVETARQQVDIAARKAGITPGTPVKISRFRVNRFREP